MKKYLLLLILFLGTFSLIGCSKSAVNEIYNKSYNVGEINIQDLQDVVVASIEKVQNAVVGVSNYQTSALTGEKLAATGSGVIYSCNATMKDGSTVADCTTTIDSNDVKTYNYLVATNRHVVEGSTSLKVYLGQEDIKVDAQLIQKDNKVDLAVVKFSHYKYIRPVEFADSDQVQSGSFAIAIGNPSGYEFWGSSTFGIVSFPKRYMADDTDGDGTADWDAEYIQHDVAINPGNSGGALINIQGQLIGINTLKILSNEIDNMGFAIPSNVVKEITSVLQTGSIPTRKTLGINVLEVKTILNPEDYPTNGDNAQYKVPQGITHGLYVVEVGDGTLADNHLQAGDIILAVNDVPIFYTHEFRAEINKVLAGETASFEVYRQNMEETVYIPF